MQLSFVSVIFFKVARHQEYIGVKGEEIVLVSKRHRTNFIREKVSPVNTYLTAIKFDHREQGEHVDEERPSLDLYTSPEEHIRAAKDYQFVGYDGTNSHLVVTKDHGKPKYNFMFQMTPHGYYKILRDGKCVVKASRDALKMGRCSDGIEFDIIFTPNAPKVFKSKKKVDKRADRDYLYDVVFGGKNKSKRKMFDSYEHRTKMDKDHGKNSVRGEFTEYFVKVF